MPCLTRPHLTSFCLSLDYLAFRSPPPRCWTFSHRWPSPQQPQTSVARRHQYSSSYSARWPSWGGHGFLLPTLSSTIRIRSCLCCSSSRVWPPYWTLCPGPCTTHCSGFLPPGFTVSTASTPSAELLPTFSCLLTLPSPSAPVRRPFYWPVRVVFKAVAMSPTLRAADKDFTTPVNVPFFVHRSNEFIMLMLGETVLQVRPRATSIRIHKPLSYPYALAHVRARNLDPYRLPSHPYVLAQVHISLSLHRVPEPGLTRLRRFVWTSCSSSSPSGQGTMPLSRGAPSTTHPDSSNSTPRSAPPSLPRTPSLLTCATITPLSLPPVACSRPSLVMARGMQSSPHRPWYHVSQVGVLRGGAGWALNRPHHAPLSREHGPDHRGRPRNEPWACEPMYLLHARDAQGAVYHARWHRHQDCPV